MQTDTYTVTFDRVGRSRDVAPITVAAKDADDLAKQIYRHVDKFLGSRWYEVTVNLEKMRGAIESGRFGTFTITKARETS